ASKPGDSGKASPVVAAARLVIANTHLLFNPKRGDIKMAQLMMLTGRVQRSTSITTHAACVSNSSSHRNSHTQTHTPYPLSRSCKADGVIICGDFNMTPDSACYHYMTKGELHVDGMNRCENSWR
ncbi:unnamed protein product, partial [Laminaria digitata]